MKCKYCNYENNPGDKYCENCGASIEENVGMNDISAIPVPPPLSSDTHPSPAEKSISAVSLEVSLSW